MFYPERARDVRYVDVPYAEDQVRRVAYEACGDSEGVPIFHLHGMPGSGSGIHPRAAWLVRNGLYFVSPDRPGYGDSDPLEGRRIVDGATDVQAIADDLGFDRFGVIGRSVGGAHALACAARIPSERLLGVIVLAAPTPPGMSDTPWFDGMTATNQAAYDASKEETIRNIMQRFHRVKEDRRNLLRDLADELTPYDNQVLEDYVVKDLIEQSFEVGLKQGWDGWAGDALALKEPWGFTVEDLNRNGVPIRFWYGEDDRFAPPEQAQKMAARINKAAIIIDKQASHFNAISVLPRLALTFLDSNDAFWRDPNPTTPAAIKNMRYYPA
jgi:pimeloyl-ACP methyl ester carboxylesterase